MLNRINKLKKQDAMILGLCLLFFIFSLTLYKFGSFDLSNQISSDDIVGKITSAKTDVRHKMTKTYFWTDASTSMPIAKGDSIFVGKASSSQVRFKDGKEFAIGENSLVKFNFKDNELSIEMGFGQIQVSRLDQKIKLTECGKVYDIDASQADLLITKSDNCDSLGVQVSKGQVKVNQKQIAQSNKPQALSENIKKLDPTTAPVVEKPQPIVETKPEPAIEPPKVVEAPKLIQKSQTVLLDQAAKPKFQWEFLEDIANYTVELSTSADFDHSQSYRTKTNSFPVTQFDSEMLYYRVKAKSEEGIESPFSDVGTMKFNYPPISINEADKKLTFVAKNSQDVGAQQKLNVSWTPIPAAAEYVVEVATDESFTDPQKTNLRVPAGTLTVPRSGTYHYRVSALAKDGRQISSSNTGTISYEKVFNIAKPVIDDVSKNLTYYFQRGLAKFIWLRWSDSTDPSKVEHYRLEIAKDQGFQEKIKAYNVKKPQFLLNESLDKGQYYWRVRSENKEQFSDWSEPGNLKVFLDNTSPETAPAPSR